MTTREPGDRRPGLDRPPGERYLAAEERAAAAEGGIPGGPWTLVAVILGGALVYTILGGVIDVTVGLIVAAGFLGWLIGKLVPGPARAAALGVVAVFIGLLGIWAFGRVEGGVLDPIAYFDAVQGWPLVVLQLLAGGGLAAAASR
jgi:hypothetical protein